MGCYTIRTNDQNTVKKILDGKAELTISRLNRYKNQYEVGDLAFIVISGDESKKEYDYENGLKAIGRISKLPYDFDDGDFSIEVDVIEFLPFVITKRDFYLYPTLIEATDIGPDVKGQANQAISKIDCDVAKDVIRAVLDLTQDLDEEEELLSIIDHDLEIRKLFEDSSYQAKVPKEEQEPFNIRSLLDDIERSNLLLSDDLVKRFITSMMSKPFTILTGLSGSGKTILAQATAFWFSNKKQSLSFEVGEIIESSLKKYKVIKSNTSSVTLEETEDGTQSILPFAIISEWIDTISQNNFTSDTSIKEIKSKAKENSKYSAQEHRYDSQLKATAFHLLEKQNENDFIKQYKIVSIGADWTNREPLLGYPNSLKEESYVKPDNGVLDLLIEASKPQNSDTPFFLILDEMNLSHVERYFADFLSAMESGESIQLHSGDKQWDGVPPEISVPDNLFVVGTVNIDETTYMFSPKVLDRANVIEFRVTRGELEPFLENPRDVDLSLLKGKGASMAEDFVDIATSQAPEYTNKNELNEVLIEFFSELRKTGAEFGFRSALEIHRFASISENVADGWDVETVADFAIMQKLLPKLHGSRRKLKKVLETLASLCLRENDDTSEILSDPDAFDIESSTLVKYSVSLDKIIRMHKRAVQNGFTSYAEA